MAVKKIPGGLFVGIEAPETEPQPEKKKPEGKKETKTAK